MAQEFIILAEHKFATTRLRSRNEGGSYKVSPNRDKMAIFFKNPDQVVRIEGKESVIAALQELEFALDDGDDGWR